jgi:hypothetical protein
MSLTYWDPQHQQVYVDCRTDWDDSPSEKKRIWDLYKNTDPPLGYDPGMIWSDGPGAEDFGILRLTPWRIEVSSIMDMMSGKEPLIWRPK